jgi:dCTP deaminase
VTGGILSGRSIHDAVVDGDIEIEPYDPKQLNPASYDLRLGNEALTYNFLGPHSVHDVRNEPTTTKIYIQPEGIVLRPGVGYLMHTAERVHTKKYVPVLDGKSSVGRLFVSVHVTAGYGDPGFDGQYTLEVTVTYPIRLYVGMRIAQMRFHTIDGVPPQLYDGNYKGDTSRGPVASRAWKQFDK